MDLKKAPKSKNVIDQTGDNYRNSLDWNYLLGSAALENQGVDPGEGLKGLTPEQVNGILFRKALEEFGGYYMNNWPEPNRYPQGRGPRKNYK